MLEGSEVFDEASISDSLEAFIKDHPTFKAFVDHEIQKLFKQLAKQQPNAQGESSPVEGLYNVIAKFFSSAVFKFYHTAIQDLENANPSNWSHTGTGSIIQAWIRLPFIVASTALGVGAFFFFPEVAGVVSGAIATLTGAPPFVSTSLATCLITLGLPTLVNFVVSNITDLLIHRQLGGPDELINTEQDRAFFAKQAKLSPETIKLIEDASISIKNFTKDPALRNELFEVMSDIRHGKGSQGIEKFIDITLKRIATLKIEDGALEAKYCCRIPDIQTRPALLNMFKRDKRAQQRQVRERVSWHESNLSALDAQIKTTKDEQSSQKRKSSKKDL